MDQSSIIFEIQAIKAELSLKIKSYLEQAMEKNGFKIVPKATLDQIRQDLGLEEKDKKSDFVANFPNAFIAFLTKIQQQQYKITKNLEPTTVSELFSQSFFPYDLPVIRKHSILERLIQDINQSIHKFYMIKKGKLQTLIQSQKIVEKNNTLPINILKMIEKDKETKKSQQDDDQTRVIDNSQPTISDLSTDTQNKIISFQYCICNKNVVVSNQLKAKSPKLQCTICQNFYHAVCLKLNNFNYKQFMCPECVIYRMDPLNKIVEVLYKPVPFQPSVHIPMKNLSFQMKYKQPNQQVEMRCIKLDGKNGSEEPTWPDIGELSLNGKKVMEFKPLQSNSSLKKRKDEKFTTMEVQYNQTNIMQIKEGTPSQDQKSNCRVALGQIYYVGVFLVSTLQPQKFIQDIKSSEENYISLETSKEFIKDYLQSNVNDEIQPESLTVSLVCQFDTHMLETPVRGNLCAHIQCFSLENMAKMMHKVNPRKWRCPICKSKCFELMIDTYQLLILQIVKNKGMKIEEVTFDKIGQVKEVEIWKELNNPEFLNEYPNYYIQNENRIVSLELMRKKESEAVIKPEKQKVVEIEESNLEPAIRKQICKTHIPDPQEKFAISIYPSSKFNSKGQSNKEAICID